MDVFHSILLYILYSTLAGRRATKFLLLEVLARNEYDANRDILYIYLFKLFSIHIYTFLEVEYVESSRRDVVRLRTFETLESKN